jgi:hypothetical protein
VRRRFIGKHGLSIWAILLTCIEKDFDWWNDMLAERWAADVSVDEAAGDTYKWVRDNYGRDKA